MTQVPTFVGIDVGKFILAVFVDPNDLYCELPNTPKGHDKLIKMLHEVSPDGDKMKIAVEPTGSYEWPLWKALHEKGFDVRQVPALQVRAFALSQGTLAKTDPLDARVLAHFISCRPKSGRVLPDGNIRKISMLVTKRRQLVDMRQSVLCHMSHKRATDIHQLDLEHKALLDKQVKVLDKAIKQAQEADEGLARKTVCLRSAPGVGPVLCSTLLAEMPELGTVSDKKIAALAGLAPINKDSGTKNGRRSIRGGRKNVRNVLYQGALSASRHNPTFKIFADKMREKGKPHKVIIVAVARKLLILINSLIANNRQWRADF